jgi:glycosidase
VDTLFDFPLYYAVRDVFAKGQPMTRLQEVLAADTNYVNARNLVTFLGLHDTARFLNEPGASIEKLQLAFTYLLTTRGTPMIYYGDEIGMNGGGDPYNRADFRGGWREDQHNAFTTAGRMPDEARVHDHVRKLLALRRELLPLRRGEMVPLGTSEKTCSYARMTADASVIVVMNNSEKTRTVRVVLPPKITSKPRWFDRLAEDAPAPVVEGALNIELPAYRAAILTPLPPNVAAGEPRSQARSEIR